MATKPMSMPHVRSIGRVDTRIGRGGSGAATSPQSPLTIHGGVDGTHLLSERGKKDRLPPAAPCPQAALIPPTRILAWTIALGAALFCRQELTYYRADQATDKRPG